MKKEVTPTAETLFEAIKELDEEFEKKMDNPKTPLKYFSETIIKKCNDLDFDVSMLNDDELGKLLNKFDEYEQSLNGEYMTSIMANFYENVHLRKSIKIKKRGSYKPVCKLLGGLG